MGAIHFEARQAVSESLNVNTVTLFARGVKPQRERRCPHCNSIIYSRRHASCGVCAQPLPDGCLFSAQESQSVRSLMEEERARHRKWLQRVNFEH